MLAALNLIFAALNLIFAALNLIFAALKSTILRKNPFLLCIN